MTSTPARHTVGIVGASGYTGAELLRLLAQHPTLDLVVATGDSMVGTRLADLYPSLAAAYGDRRFDAYSPDAVDGLDLVFCGLPHGVSMDVVPDIRGRAAHIVDLGSDFRLHDAALYPEWYGAEHHCPELLDDFVYGLPELFRDDLRGAELIAATGCNAATATFALAPLLAAGPDRGRRPHRGSRDRSQRRRSAPQAPHDLLHRRRRRHALRAADPPAHPRDRTGAHRSDRGCRPRCCSPRTWPR